MSMAKRSPRMPRAQRDAMEFSRMQALAATLTKTDRILTGNTRVGVQFTDPGVHGAPSATDGITIRIDPTKVSLGSASGLVNIQGLNYHEVCHILFTPRDTDATLREIRYRGLSWVWNILEDMRIETLFAAMYGNAAKFFTAPIITYFLNEEDAWPLAHLFTYGRRFLPKEMRDEFRAQFVGTEDQRKRGERIIDAYRKVKYNPGRLDLPTLHLVEDFSELMAEFADPNGGGNPLANSHPKCANATRAQGEPSEQAERAASQRRDEKDAAQHEEEGTEDAEDANDPGNAAEGTEEGPEADGDDSGDAGSGEDQSGDGDPGQDDSPSGEDGSGPGNGAGDDGDSDGDAERGNGSASGGQASGDDGDSGGLTGESSVPPEGKAAPPGDDTQTRAGLNMQELREALSEALENVLSDDDVCREISNLTTGMNDVRNVDTDAGDTTYVKVSITGDMAAVSASVEDEIRRLNEMFESGWNYGTDHGRLNVARAMHDDADYEEIYDAWEEGHEQDSGLCVVIALDLSYSMWSNRLPGANYGEGDNRITAACKAMWMLLRGLQGAGVETVALGFTNPCVRLFGRDEDVEPAHYRSYTDSCDYTDSSDAVLEASRMLETSDKPNKLFVMITDGGMTAGLEESVQGMAGMDASKMLVSIGADHQRPEFANAFHVRREVNTPMELVPLVREAVTALLSEAQRR